VPSDVLACRRDPADLPDRDLNLGKIEGLWNIDRDNLGRVSTCFRRPVCQYRDVRAGIIRLETVMCGDIKRKGGKSRM
jgi:hypothetical protein